MTVPLWVWHAVIVILISLAILALLWYATRNMKDVDL